MPRTLVLLIVAAMAVPLLAQDQSRVVVASDERTVISVPSNWKTLELNEAAEIQVGNPEEEAYLIVLAERKEDLYGWNLDKHSRVTLGHLLSSLAFPTITGPKELTINGNKAVQYEIQGASDSLRLVYIHTTVETPNGFNQILAWTVPSYAEKVKPQLLKAVKTFKEAEK